MRLRQRNKCGQKQVCCFYDKTFLLLFFKFKANKNFVVPEYYNYYYGGYAQNPEALNGQEEQSAAAAAEVTMSCEGVGPEVAGQPDNIAATSTEVCSFTNMLKVVMAIRQGSFALLMALCPSGG